MYFKFQKGLIWIQKNHSKTRDTFRKILRSLDKTKGSMGSINANVSNQGGRSKSAVILH